jgi:hypothetical protein
MSGRRLINEEERGLRGRVREVQKGEMMVFFALCLVNLAVSVMTMWWASSYSSEFCPKVQ